MMSIVLLILVVMVIAPIIFLVALWVLGWLLAIIEWCVDQWVERT